ncbi:ABC transporter ATP-binding protein [bacterium]|nr:ABC transporter ATP-binding protein [bacterium]
MIELQSVSFKYGPQTVIRSVSCRLHYGDAIAVLGLNGSGKTTLLHLLAGLSAPTTGKRIATAQTVGWKSAVLPLYCPFRVKEVLEMAPAHWSRHPEMEKRADATFDIVPIQLRRFDTLSTGEQHRVLLARIFRYDLGVVILDEPMTGLDIRFREQLAMMITEFRNRNGIAVVATHELDRMSEIFNQVWIVKDGAIKIIRSPLNSEEILKVLKEDPSC